jgi:DNA-binding response OmpR family regulator
MLAASFRKGSMAKRILLIDDDYDFVSITKKVIEEGGYEVEVAYNGNEGLAKINKAKPDLIVLDVMMPGTDGWEICSALKDSKETEDIPVIMLTAVGSSIKTTKYTRRAGMETEAEDYIPKPVDPPMLLERIKFQLERQRSK